MVIKSKFNEQCIIPSQISLIFNARIFFRKFTTWIRAYIISSYTGVGTPEEIFGRVYLETSNFGDMLHLVFGLDNSAKSTQMMNRFTFGIRDLITAQLAGNTEAVYEIVDNLYKNADNGAAFLASINPYFDEAEWRNLLRTYVQYTLEEANLFITGNYKNEIEIYDRLTALTNQMGYSFAQAINDYMAPGLQNTPYQGSQPCITLEQLNEVYNIITLWFDLTIWSRNFMLSKYKGIGDVNEVFNRLQQVVTEFINALKQLFGESPALNNYQLQLNEYVDLIDSLTTAQMEGNSEEVNRIIQLLYQNSIDRAASFASLSPSSWDQNELRTRIYDNIRVTIDEATTFLTGEYARNLDIYSTLLNKAESMGNFMAQGLIKYINSQHKESS